MIRPKYVPILYRFRDIITYLQKRKDSRDARPIWGYIITQKLILPPYSTYIHQISNNFIRSKAIVPAWGPKIKHAVKVILQKAASPPRTNRSIVCSLKTIHLNF